MNTSPTIDSMPRELLAKWLAMFEGGIASSDLSALRELTRKALLDAQAEPAPAAKDHRTISAAYRQLLGALGDEGMSHSDALARATGKSNHVEERP